MLKKQCPNGRKIIVFSQSSQRPQRDSFFAGRETTRPAKDPASLKGKENDEFLLWRLSLPEQKINLSVSSVGSSEAGERQLGVI
jgi:hypothetical protein